MSHLLPVYPRLPLTLVRAQGVSLFTDDGREILDFYGGHAVTPLGHGHPALTAALTEAHRTLDFFSNSLHLPAQERAAAAVIGDSAHLRYVHFLSSGTEANEAAIHTARHLTGREKIVTLTSGFHGRTLGSLSVTGIPGYRKKLQVAAPAGWSATITLNDPASLDAIDGSVAGVLIESVPSLGGIYLPDAAWLQAVAARAREVGALLLFDEVQGGVGRLGTWFGHERFGVRPDVVTLAKSLGGGFPVSAMVCTAEVGDRLGYGDLGTTFGGGPMAAAMVETTARVIREEGLMGRVLAIFDGISSGLAGLPGVEVRGAGCLIGVQTPLSAKAVQEALLARDLLVGTSSQPETIRLLPPYVLTDAHVERFVGALRDVLSEAGVG